MVSNGVSTDDVDIGDGNEIDQQPPPPRHDNRIESGSKEQYYVDEHQAEQCYRGSKYSRPLDNYEQNRHAPKRASQVVEQQAAYHHPQCQVDMDFLDSQNHRLRGERDQARGENDVLRRQLEKAQNEISELQAAGLATVDRYQPETDEAIEKKFKLVESKTKQFVAKILAKQKSSLEVKEWEEKLRGLMLRHTTQAFREGKLDLNNSILKRKVLRNVVWRFVCKEVFKQPFACFGDMGANVSSVYEQLYNKPGMQHA
jgi:hypothetical protein